MAQLQRSTAGPTQSGAAGWVAVAGLVLLAVNLRPTAVSIGPVLGQLSTDLALSPTVAGVLTSLPTLCFAGFGALAPGVAKRLGLHRTILLALLLVVGGQLGRAAVHQSWAFLALSAVALSGMAAANVLLPSLVKRHFPSRLGLMTAVYSTAMTIGLTLAGMLTVPMATALGGWRPAFVAGASVAAVAVLPWLVLARLDRPGGGVTGQRPHIPLSRVARTKLGWAMAIFFGFQSAQAYSVFGWLATIYTDAGFSPTAAGVYLGIATGVGIPLAFAWPAYTARNPRPVALLLAIAAIGLVADLGLMLAPATLPWLWAILLAIGTSSFPMVLALIGLRARTSEGTAALSGFAQSVGYLIAFVGPFSMGALREATGGWSWPMALMMAMVVPMTLGGLVVCRSGMIEDELT